MVSCAQRSKNLERYLNCLQYNSAKKPQQILIGSCFWPWATLKVLKCFLLLSLCEKKTVINCNKNNTLLPFVFQMVQKQNKSGCLIFEIHISCRLTLCRYFLTFPACFYFSISFYNLNYNCSYLSDLRNLQEQVKKAFCYQKLLCPFTVWINSSSDLKVFANSRLKA